MSALVQLKELLLNARKQRDKESIELYSYLLGQVELKHKDATDDEVYSVYNIYTRAIAVIDYKDSELGVKRNKEVAIIKNLLPTKLTDAKIKDIITQLKATSLGEVMKHFKLNYPNQYDSLVVKNIFEKLK